jgi:dipeptidyl-peptidase-4
MRLGALLLPALLFADVSPEHDKGDTKRVVHNDPVGSYHVITMHGWTVYVSRRYKDHPQLRRDALAEMENQLFSVAKLIPSKILADMRKTKIWLEHEFPGVATYHPSDKWLTEHGYNPAKAKSVEIPRAEGFLDHKGSRPANIMLHELCHAYHHQVLDFENRAIISAYTRAKKSGKYDKVMFINGQTVEHYAMSNPMEFFAECSETFLSVNDYYPFVRGELQKSNPEIYKLMESIWGKWGTE